MGTIRLQCTKCGANVPSREQFRFAGYLICAECHGEILNSILELTISPAADLKTVFCRKCDAALPSDRGPRHFAGYQICDKCADDLRQWIITRVPPTCPSGDEPEANAFDWRAQAAAWRESAAEWRNMYFASKEMRHDAERRRMGIGRDNHP